MRSIRGHEKGDRVFHDDDWSIPSELLGGDHVFSGVSGCITVGPWKKSLETRKLRPKKAALSPGPA